MRAGWLLIVVLAVFTVMTATYIAAGPVEVGDTSRYLNGADEFLTTGAISGKASSYQGYVLFLAAVKSFTGDPQLQKWLIILVQGLALGIALLCLYSLGCMLFSRPAGLVAAGLYAVNFYALRWAPYIATESLFMAFVIISCWFCVKTLNKPWLLLPAVVVMLFTVLIRPNGIATLPVFVLFFVLSLRGGFRIAALGVLTVTVIALSPMVKQELNDAASHEDLVAHLEKGTIIWRTEAIDMPKLERKSGDQLKDVVRYIVSYPAQTAALAGKRLFAAWSWHRDDYSARHQVFLGLLMPALYVLAFIGLWARVRSGFTTAHLLPVLLILAQSTVIAVSFANHDHRFVNAVMPLIFLFAAAGGVAVYNWVSRRRAD